LSKYVKLFYFSVVFVDLCPILASDYFCFLLQKKRHYAIITLSQAGQYPRR